MIKWLQENYPEAAESLTRVVTVEMKEDPRLYYFAKDEYDFMYSSLNASYILSFLAEMKNKKDGGKFDVSIFLLRGQSDRRRAFV